MQGVSEASIEIILSKGINDEDDAPSSYASYPCCPICYEDGPICVLSNCDHAFCNDCLQEYCRVMIKSRQSALMTCPMTQPFCTATIDEQDFPKFLLPNNNDLYQVIRRQIQLKNDPTLSQCPRCNELVTAPHQTSAGAVDHVDNGVERVMVKSDVDKTMVECEIVGENTNYTGASVDRLEAALTPTWADTNTRTCAGCQFTFCVRHGSAHLHQSCAEFTSQQGSIRIQQKHTVDAATRQTLEQYTKPCPHCGVAICKASGCDHIVCPLCHQDFCFACGTHAYLTGSGMIRSCQRCQKSFVDHRYDHQRSFCWIVFQACMMIPLLLPGWILYVAIMSCACIVTGCFGCCFGCGKFAHTEGERDYENMESQKEQSDLESNVQSGRIHHRSQSQQPQWNPWLGIKQGVYLICLPVVCLLRDLGVACNSFPRLLPGERDPIASEIPSLAPSMTTESDDSSK